MVPYILLMMDFFFLLRILLLSQEIIDCYPYCYFNLKTCTQMAKNSRCFKARKRCINFHALLIQTFPGIPNLPIKLSSGGVCY